MKELYEQIFKPEFFDLMHPKWFKDNILKDCLELESALESFRIKYGIKLNIKIEPMEEPKSRKYGGIVEKLDKFLSDKQ